MDLTELRKKMTANKSRVETTYKELCELIKEDEIRGGGQREKQKKEWGRYFKFTINKKKRYVITKIYDTPLPIEESRLENELLNYNICFELLKKFCKKEIDRLGEDKLEQIINEYLHNGKGITVSCTKSELAVKIGLVNEIFKEYIQSPNQLANKLDINKNTVIEFFSKVKNYYSRDIQNAFERLERNNVILFEELYMGEFLIDSDLFLVHSKDKYCDDTTDIHHEPIKEIRQFTEAEKDKLMEIISKILKEYDCKDYAEFIQTHPEEIGNYFRKRTDAVFRELKCIRFYKTYGVTFTPDFIFYRKKKLENQLTKMFANRVLENKERDIIKKIEEINNQIEKNFDPVLSREFLGVLDNDAILTTEYLLEQRERYEIQISEFKTLINTGIYRYKKVNKKEDN